LPEAQAGQAATALPSLPPLPAWWPYAAGALAALLLLGGGAFLWRRRRKPAPLRLAAPVAGASGEPAGEPAGAGETPRVDLTLDITAATRSVMMFTLHYRLTIANRSGRAVNDCNAAAKLVCARGNAGAAAGAAQGLESIARIGPHQARSITGTLQLPISAISPLRQGQTPLFIPLVHVTLEGEGLPADTKTFVIGTPSPSGRIHPIPLDQPPGGIAGLVAQAVVVPAASAA
jgi:Meckel syndrome type 1 protein